MAQRLRLGLRTRCDGDITLAGAVFVPQSMLAHRSKVEQELRRDKMLTEDTTHRAPLPAWVPRSAKRDSGRTKALRTPAHLRVIGVELDEDSRALIRQKLGQKLGKFVASIERVTVRVVDANGPRGGVDHVCIVKVVLSGLPSVVVERRDAAPHVAIDLALRATEQAVRRSVGRRRMKPLRQPRFLAL
jgi:ribosome-associated translation inhibitor RaiA